MRTGSIDLLKLVDPVRDTLGGNWSWEGSSLVCPGGSRWALVMPKPPPDGYRWTIVAERISGYGSLNLCLVIGGRQTMAVLEGYGNQSSGLNRLDGRTADRNETTRQGAIFQQGKPTTIVCTVGRSRVQVTCDGNPIIDWTGSPQRLSLDRFSWPDLPGHRLAVASYQGVRVRISKMELMEIDPGEAAPPASLAQSPRAERSSSDVPKSRPGRYGLDRPPWASRVPPRPPSRTAQPSTAGQTPSLIPSRPTPVIPVEQLPDAVVRSKQSVCIIEHPLGSGTGFVVGDNLVATNAHVVDGAYVEELEFHFSSAGVMKCRASRVLYEDGVRDLCLLEVNTDQAPIPIAADHVFQRGEKVVIIGNPALGETDIVLRDAVMGGTINALVHTDKCDFYQIDASVNPGSSGGPVLNLDGEVVGVVAMKATERGAAEIRRALRELDDSFAAHFNTFPRKGIAFGIPVNALGQAIKQLQGQSESAASRLGDQHMARVVLARLSILGGLHLIRMQVYVPSGVRQQASRVSLRNVAPSTLHKIKLVPLMPEFLARALARELESDEVRKIIGVCSTGLDEKVRHLRESEHFDQMVAQNLESLHRTVLETNAHVERPPVTYQAFSQAVSKQADKLKSLIRRLTDQLEVAQAAYTD